MSNLGEDQDEVGSELYLIGSPNSTTDTATEKLGTVLEIIQPAAFLLPGSLDMDQSAASALRGYCAARNMAFFVEDDLDLVQSLAADGLHQRTPALTRQSRSALTKDQVLGVDAGRSRHDAMEAGEDGADYIAFGRLGDPVDQELLDLITWWRELFVLPCLAYAGSIDDGIKLAKSGCDFIGVADVIWEDPGGPASAVSALKAAMSKN